jgi:hypothetical protein
MKLYRKITYLRYLSCYPFSRHHPTKRGGLRKVAESFESRYFRYTLDSIHVQTQHIIGPNVLAWAQMEWYLRHVTEDAMDRVVALGSVVFQAISTELEQLLDRSERTVQVGGTQ